MIKPGIPAIFTLACLTVFPGLVPAGNSEADWLSPVEQEVLEELNLARTQPRRYAEFLVDMRRYFNGKHLERPGEIILITVEGVAAVDEAIAFLRTTGPVPALKASRGLSLAARALVRDQRNGAMGHRASDGSQPWDRMNRYGTWSDRVAENIAYGGKTARGTVIQLLVDDGVPGRGHRLNMFSPAYRFVGIACGAHARLGDMCVMDFAMEYTERVQR